MCCSACRSWCCRTAVRCPSPPMPAVSRRCTAVRVACLRAHRPGRLPAGGGVGLRRAAWPRRRGRPGSRRAARTAGPGAADSGAGQRRAGRAGHSGAASGRGPGPGARTVLRGDRQPAAVVRAAPAVRAGPGAGPGTRRARSVGAGLRRSQPAGRRRRRGADRPGRWAGHRAAARLPLLPRRGPATPALPPAAAPAPIRVQKTLESAQSAQRCCATAQARFLPVPEVAGRARRSVLGRGAGWQVP